MKEEFRAILRKENKKLIDGQTFKVGKKVYIFTKTLEGYDDYFAKIELNRLLSFGLVKKIKVEDKYLNYHNELPQYPRDNA